MRRSFISVCIDRQSYDYDTLSNYLRNSIYVSKALFTENGFFIDLCCHDDFARKEFIKDVMLYNITDMSIFDVLYEEFIGDR